MACAQRIESHKKDPDQSLFSPTDRVEIKLDDGEVQSGPPIRFAIGHARNAVERPRLWAKFDECTNKQLDKPKRENLFSKLCDLNDVGRISELYR
jgi:hypothetical protein